ncbi:MAG: hypothetical protein NT030_04235, partial [Candidatus Saganbacteria bacterium]|nr:hypothetical protein [Candidatus Saganbacteria bacterium]
FHIKYFPDIIVYHETRRPPIENKRSVYYFTRNLIWIIWKYFPIKDRMLLTLRVLFIRGARVFLMGNLFAFSRAAWDAFTLKHEENHKIRLSNATVVYYNNFIRKRIVPYPTIHKIIKFIKKHKKKGLLK